MSDKGPVPGSAKNLHQARRPIAIVREPGGSTCEKAFTHDD